MPVKKISKGVVYKSDIVSKMGFDPKKVSKTKYRTLTEARRAKLLEVTMSALKTPITLSPTKMIKGKSNLLLFSSMMVDPTWPVSSGQALFSSAYPGVIFPSVQVAFPRIKTGKMHLVEFNLVLNMNKKYKFRIFEYPLGDFMDVEVNGPGNETLVALVPPIDEISGSLELGAAIQQRNTVNDNAGWVFHSVIISTT